MEEDDKLTNNECRIKNGANHGLYRTRLIFVLDIGQ